MNIRKKQDELLVGQVIEAQKQRYIVMSDNKRFITEVSGRFNYIAVQKSDYPVVGDYVYFRSSGDDMGIIERIETRFGTISRLDVGSIAEEHILASNVDIAFICMSLNNDFNIKKLQNFLSLTYGSDIETIILLTKKDLVDDYEKYIKQIKIINQERVIVISSYDMNDIDSIKKIIDKKTVVFIGSSGVGKSTIINKLCDEEIFATNTIRSSDAQGRHTTTHRELITLPTGGKVIDTPGIRIVSSYFVDENNFNDINSLAKDCQYRNCTHTNEPNCNVLQKLYEGSLPYERYNQFIKAVKFNKFNEKRQKERIRLQNKKKRK